LITGINGQIGSYLKEILLLKGYDVYGIVRNKQIIENVKTIECDINNVKKLKKIILQIKPDEIYNFAAQADATVSIKSPENSFYTNSNTVLSICEIIKNTNIKLFQANSSEIFKGIDSSEITETLLTFYPKNPYAIAKLAAYWTTRWYREYYNLYVSNGIIFNTESPRRNKKFVINKIISKIKNNKLLKIGNINIKKDWIHAYDVAYASWLSLQQPHSDDYVISLNNLHSVREVIEYSFKYINKNIIWEGSDLNEIGRTSDEILVKIDPRFFRKYEEKNTNLIGNNTKLKNIGWIPKYTWEKMIEEIFDTL
jgi:GDPmannose 4,6-dehydratase